MATLGIVQGGGQLLKGIKNAKAAKAAKGADDVLEEAPAGTQSAKAEVADEAPISNPVPDRVARVIPGEIDAKTLGRPGAEDVFVTATDDIAGMNAKEIAERLTIPESPTFTVIEFPTPSNVASPVLRSDPGFIGGGRTAGGAREFVVPNGAVPEGRWQRFE